MSFKQVMLDETGQAHTTQLTNIATSLATVASEMQGEAKRLVEKVQNLGSVTSSTLNIAINLGNIVKLTVANAVEISFSGATADKCSTVTLVMTNGGNFTVTWNGNILWANAGVAPTLTGSGLDILTFICVDGTHWYGIGATDIR